jgi:hypothetical protein
MTYSKPALVIFGHVVAARITEEVAADALTRMDLAHTTRNVRAVLTAMSYENRAYLVALSDEWVRVHGMVEVRQ